MAVEQEQKLEDEEVKTVWGRVRRRLRPSGPPDILEMRLHTPQELEAISQQSRALEAIVAEELESVRREGEKEEERRVARRVERRRAESLENIRAAADFTCRAGLIYSEKLEFPKVSDQSFYCLNDPGWSSDDDCQARIYSMLLGQLCKTGTFDPEPINEMRSRVYGPQVGVSPPVTGLAIALPWGRWRRLRKGVPGPR